nr:MAG TPA: hypothetical protein [Caudoviricetes sp.]
MLIIFLSLTIPSQLYITTELSSSTDFLSLYNLNTSITFLIFVKFI